jgi:hypothetical protein
VAEKNNYKYGINPIVTHDYFGGKEQMYFFEDINYGEVNNTTYGELPPETNNIWEEKREFHDGYNYHPLQLDIFDIPDNTKLVIYCAQDPRYFDKNKIRQWLKIKNNNVIDCEKILKNNNIELDNNLCVISARGGEYRGIPDLFLRKRYWEDAINHMLHKNQKMRFICITEDPEFFKDYFDFPVYHFNICCDYHIVNHAKNLIISNSGFGLFPTWLNEEANNIIAPKFWARHNIGKWASSSIWEFGKDNNWNFLDKDGKLFNYEDILKENQIS